MNTSDSNFESIFIEKVTSYCQCPICYNLPRTLPVASCSRGHVICENCRSNVHLCPLCRGSLYNNCTNAVVGLICEAALHSCRFEPFGCGIRGSISNIEMHERGCPERTVHCPFIGCKKEVQMKGFEVHAITTECAIPIGKTYSN